MKHAQLQIQYGQASEAGRKPVNQDFHGLCIPQDYLLESKGIAIGLADGVSSSEVSQVASETAVSNFLEDYYSTPESWPVKKSAVRVLNAINSWLYAQTRKSQNRRNFNKGYVTTFSAVILKSHSAHLFHCGDSRIYRLADNRLVQLTEDHRTWISEEQSYLNRAMGIKNFLNLDYHEVSTNPGDIFILATDGIYEWVDNTSITQLTQEYVDDLDQAAQKILQAAYDAGSNDNLSIQIIRITQLPEFQLHEIKHQLDQLPFSRPLEVKEEFDGYLILRELSANTRSYVYLAQDIQSERKVILKLPALEQQHDLDYLERFLMEEWIARRLNHPHLLKSFPPERKRNYLYTVSEFIEGQTLHQWMKDNKKADLQTMRSIIGQVIQALYALHRLEILHRDLRPHNIMIDNHGTVTLIDFGSVKIPGVAELRDPKKKEKNIGTALYSATEFFLGNTGDKRSDQFSLAVIAYELLSGKLPYGTDVAKANTRAAQLKLKYRSLSIENPEIPAWVDEAIKKAVNPNPQRRYEEISEFFADLNHPNSKFASKHQPPLIESNPLLFWKGLSLFLFLTLLIVIITK
ncbi:bifunctional protein-serine/threonine kinase/phosphatase [Thiomicrorhabdus heinhorstiae]|uniref:Bifunctional protein-serine/threonine kinase/phosphatase n=1 Tax=Thiomicrorhabdus heinhorstiae TaxID=2748010 RepID=A0ABS0BVJ2_9GAMM|nr:bifunctional protein-serine/threonine kinase/phosphatase [Thiomicrorhabdus heinhorstiae]MBF6057369.1 bifunctional protein-serine/threonine kinase/phosphatase [Thiomicrorhabdus heinhorstiae]